VSMAGQADSLSGVRLQGVDEYRLDIIVIILMTYGYKMYWRPSVEFGSTRLARVDISRLRDYPKHRIS